VKERRSPVRAVCGEFAADSREPVVADVAGNVVVLVVALGSVVGSAEVVGRQRLGWFATENSLHDLATFRRHR
jgi:hypothetical protein